MNRIAAVLRITNLLLLAGVLAVAVAIYRRATSQPPAAQKPPAPARRQPTDAEIDRLQARLALLPNEAELHAEMAMAYMRKAREAGEPEYYRKAQQAVEHALELKPDNYLAVKVMSWVLAGQHRFGEALPWAERARVQQPKDPFNYGTLGDAYLETGNYEAAAEAFQKMVDLKPGVNSYSRAAYLRELMGDRAGAIEIMELAVKAASPRDPENLAWCHVQLGHLYFRGGRFGHAEAEYQAALAAFPDYYMALASMARAKAAQGRFAEAIQLMEKTVRLTSLPEYLAELGDLYAHTGRQGEAEKMYERFERACAAGGAQHNHELAIFYADHGRKLDRALELMRQDLAVNKDIFAYDTFAWTAYKAGRLEEAGEAIRQALRLRTEDARILYHAAVIYRALGRPKEARRSLEAVLRINPYFDYRERTTLAAMSDPHSSWSATGS